MPDLNSQQSDAFLSLLQTLGPSLALALSEQLNQNVTFDPPTLRHVPIQDILSDASEALYAVFSLTLPAPVENVLAFSQEAAFIFGDLIAGGDGTAPPSVLNEKQVERLGASMSGLARGLATALANASGDPVELETCATSLGAVVLPPVFALNGSAVEARFGFTIEGTLESGLTFLLSPEFVLSLLPDSVTGASDDVVGEDELAAMLGELGDLSDREEADPHAGTLPGRLPSFPGLAALAGGVSPGDPASALPRGIELILDIPLDVTVELGRVRMLIRDVLELSSGSIVELDRVAGEPVDLLVNGRLVARGEVVVIEDNFGIRVTEIVSPAERVAGLGRGR